MSAAEREARGAKSTVIVERLVRAQLRAVGCERFDLGIERVILTIRPGPL